MSDRVPIWLDCDPGHDDAFAIILAGHSSRINLLGISTCAGNQSIEKTTKNALKILQVSGLSKIPVAKGIQGAIMDTAVFCPEIHGESGLDGTEFPELRIHPVQTKAVLFMAEQILAYQPGKVVVVATGPMTNVALMLRLFPEVHSKIERIVFMGGAIGPGNTHPVAEFNIQTDPESAKIVFHCGLPVVMIPLEVSHTVLVTKDIFDRIAKLSTPFSNAMVDLLSFFSTTYKQVFRFDDPPLHDPLTVAYCVDPSLFTYEEMYVDIECGGLCRGQTVCDRFHLFKKNPNLRVCTTVNVPAFWDLILDSIEKANAVSEMNKH